MDMGLLSSLSVVVPAYNEEANVTRVVLRAEAVLRNHVAERLEWILVDDGSTDGTWSEIKRLADSIPHVISLRHSTNRGLGAAVWTGVTNASSDWCVWMSADGQTPPQAIADMAELAHGADIVLLMREETERTRWRQIVTLGLYGLMRMMLGFVPYGYSGTFLARREILQDIRLHSTTGVQNYAVVLHCQRNGNRIRQTRTVIQPRMSGRSKVANLPTMLKTLFDIMKLRFVA